MRKGRYTLITGLFRSFRKSCVSYTPWTLHRATVDTSKHHLVHSAIGDAVDDDSSGFVSVYEANNFLFRRPSKWSVPEWFALYAFSLSPFRFELINQHSSSWAQGWSDTNLMSVLFCSVKFHGVLSLNTLSYSDIVIAYRKLSTRSNVLLDLSNPRIKRTSRNC